MFVQATLRGDITRGTDGSSGHHLPVAWTFDPTDPLIFTLHFASENTWAIDRTMLVDGGGVCRGDVWVERSPGRLLLMLTGDEGTSLIEFPLGEVDALLDGAERLVPLAEAVPEHAIDQCIAALLGPVTP